ncbi:CDC42 small effector protein 2 isoform X2 [Podarcis raffonei]|uniref:CDC42 small effector protein 2 isoform X2 n=1 Tax=Podarcis raffonei TaxID=65483 RepID=UPI0023296FF3|nr:CDC42 small effector protein 2 isoform X2 [Podarcis raffonei]
MRGSPRSPPKRLRSPSEARLSTGIRSVSAGWGEGGGGRRGGGPTHLPSRLPGLGESEQEPPPPPHHPSATRAARASPLKADRGRAEGAKRKEASGDGDASFPPGRLPLRPRRLQRSFLSAIPGAAGRGAETQRDRTPVQKGSETKEAAGEGEVNNWKLE